MYQMSKLMSIGYNQMSTLMSIGHNLETADSMEDDNGNDELQRIFMFIEKDLGVTFTNDLKQCSYPMQ